MICELVPIPQPPVSWQWRDGEQSAYSQGMVSLTLSPRALQSGWALGWELQRRPGLRQPLPLTGKF